MEFSKTKSKDRRSLPSVFSLTKKWILLSNQKPVLLANFTNLIKYLEYFIFNFQLWCLSLKKNYLLELITFKKINMLTSGRNDIFLFLKKLKNSRSTILLFFNIPFIISLIISEIFESIIKKTIYLYRFFLLLSIPVLIFCVNKNLVLHNKKDYFSFLLPENKKICLFSENYQDQKMQASQVRQDAFSIKNLRKTNYAGARNHILKLISQKYDIFSSNQSFGPLKAYLRSTVFSGTNGAQLTKVRQDGLKNFFLFNGNAPFNNIQHIDRIRKTVDQKSVIFSKWFSIYIKLKTNYLIKFHNNYSIQQKNLKKVCGWSDKQIVKSNSTLNYLKFFQFGQFTPKNNYLKQKFLKNFDNFFFSVSAPRALKYLSNARALKKSSNKHFVNVALLEGQNLAILTKKPLSLEDNINWYKEKNKNEKLLHSINKQEWMRTIRHWIKFYPSQDKFSCLFKNKQKLKENVQLVQNLHFVMNFLKNFFSFWTSLEQIYCNKSLLNQDPVGSSIFGSNKQVFFKISRSYKNALNWKNFFLPNGPPERSSLALANLDTSHSYLEGLRLSSIKINKKKLIFKKINYLYNFSFQFSKPIAILADPEVFFLSQKISKARQVSLPGPTAQDQKPVSFFSIPYESMVRQDDPTGAHQNFQIFLNDSWGTLYDLDFYLKNYKINDDLFGISRSSFSFRDLKKQKNMLEKEKNFFSNSSQPSGASATFQKNFKIIKKKREKLQNSIISTKFNFLKKYNKWIFTPQWWSFCKHGLLLEIDSFIENLLNNTQNFLYQISTKLGNTNKKELPSTQKFKNISNIFVFHMQSWNKLLAERSPSDPGEPLFKPLWINLKLLPSLHNSSWSFFSWFIAISIVYYHWLPMLTGVIYLYLWLDFEKIRSLADAPSWKVFLTILTHNSFDSPSQQLRLAGYLSRGRMFLIYSKFYRIYNKIFFIFNRLNYLTTLDLSRRNKNLVSNSLITKKTLKSKYYFWNINNQNNAANVPFGSSIGPSGIALNGFNFFQKWYEKNFRISSLRSVGPSSLRAFSLVWLSDLSFYNKFLILNYSNKLDRISINSKSKPKPLAESLTYTQRWLFIGSLESGKSFVIKNLAASLSEPLIHISIKDLKNATPNSKYTKIRKQKRWVEQLSERSFFLENIFNLAKILAPSILWISDLHDFETKNNIQEKNAQKFDMSLLMVMATLLKKLSIDLVPEKQNHITFIGSTEYPRLLDPKFVSRQRLDLIVNFRTPSFNQRQTIFTFLLKTKGFTLKGAQRSLYELNSNTRGYTFRDINSLVNETLLIKTKEKTTLIDSNTIRLALYRQTSTQSVKYKIIRQENLHYKIGKALVQTILVYPKSIMLLSKYHDLWKTKFYFLSNTYLEVSSKKAITTEFVLLTQILNCLAGSAARDAWILSNPAPLVPVGRPDMGPRETSGLALTSQLKHDFSIASNILQSLLVEFSMRDITSPDGPKKKKNREDILKTFHFNFLKRALSYLDCFDPNGPSYINWSIKGAQRLSFNWILFFSGIKYFLQKQK